MSPLARTVRDTLAVLAAPVFVLTVHVLRVVFLTALYAFDMLMHFLGGASIAVAALVLGRILVRRGILSPLPPPWFSALTVIGTVGLVGIFWEFYEFAVDALGTIAPAQGGLADTMGDLALDLLGGIAVLLATPWVRQRVKK